MFSRIWDTFTGQCLKTIVDLDEKHAVSFISISLNNKYIIGSYLDSKIRLWDISSGKILKIFQGHKNSKYCSTNSFSTSNIPLVVSGSEDNMVYIYDLVSNEVIQTLQGHEDVVLAVDCHPTRNIIASSSIGADHSIMVWLETESENKNRE